QEPAGQCRLGEYNPALAPVGNSARRIDWNWCRVCGIIISVLRQRVADATQHQVPNLPLVGANVHTVTPEGSEKYIKITRGVRDRVNMTAIRVKHNICRVSRPHQHPVRTG